MKKKKHKRFVPNYHGVVAEAIDLWLIYVAYTNIGLAIFNLIPIPPLDGSRLVFTVLPNIVDEATAKECFSRDYVCCEFKKHYRSNANFI